MLEPRLKARVVECAELRFLFNQPDFASIVATMDSAIARSRSRSPRGSSPEDEHLDLEVDSAAEEQQLDG